MKMRRLVLWWSGCIFCTGCGNSEPGGSESAAESDEVEPVDAEPLRVETTPLLQADLPSAFAKASCGAYTRCSCAWEELTSCVESGACFEDEGACVQQFEANAEVLFRGGEESYDAAVARECVNLILTSPCENGSWFETCGSIFGASAAPEALPADIGEACNGTCQGAPGAGYCSVVLGGENRQCSFDAGLQCQDGTCQPVRPGGAACDKELQCEPELACIDGSCSPRLVSGGACAADGENPCVAGSYCARGTCVDQLADGTECDADDECVTGRCDRVCLARGQQPVCLL